MYLILNELYDDPVTTRPTLDTYRRKAIQFDNPDHLAKSLHYLGYYHRSLLNYDSAEICYTQSLNVALDHQLHKRVAQSYADLGTLCEAQGNPKHAYDAYLKGMAYAREHKEVAPEARCLINIGILLEQRGNYAQSLIHLQTALDLCLKHKLVGYLASTYFAMADVNLALGETARAEQLYHLARQWSIKRLNNNTLLQVQERLGELNLQRKLADSAVYYFRNMQHLAHQNAMTLYIARARIGLSNVYRDQHQLDSSNSFIQSAIAQLEEMHDSTVLQKAYLSAGLTALEEQNATGAQAFCERSFDLAAYLNDAQIEMQACQCLQKAYYNLGNHKAALRYMQQYAHLSDSLQSREQAKAVVRMQLQSDFEQQQLIDSLQAQNKVAQLEATHKADLETTNRTLALAIIIAIITMLAAGILWYALRTNRKQRLELERIDKLNKQIFSIIAHDFKGPLMSMQLFAEVLEKPNLTPEQIKLYSWDIRNQVERTDQILSHLLNWARAELSVDLDRNQTSPIEPLLKEVLSDLNEQIHRKEIRVNDQVPLNASIVLNPDIFRICARNLISNAIKYSPKGAEVCINYDVEKQQLFVTDFGSGMSAEVQSNLFLKPVYPTIGTAAEKGFGMGLFISHELLAKSGWTLWVESRLGQGTSFFIAPKANS